MGAWSAYTYKGHICPSLSTDENGNLNPRYIVISHTDLLFCAEQLIVFDDGDFVTFFAMVVVIQSDRTLIYQEMQSVRMLWYMCGRDVMQN